MLEGKFNSNMKTYLRRNRVWCYKTADKFQHGVPDLYVRGGRWSEGKVIKVGGQNREINVWDKLTGAQQTFGADLINSGDKVWVHVRVEAPGGNYIWFCEFPFLANIKRFSVRELTNPWESPLTICQKITKETDYGVAEYFR